MRYIKSILSVILSLLLLCSIPLSSLAGSKSSLSSEEPAISSSSAYMESEQMMSQSPNTSFFHVDSQNLEVSQTESETPISSESKSEVSSELPQTEVLSEAVSEPSSSKQSDNQTSSEATTESPELESTENNLRKLLKLPKNHLAKILKLPKKHLLKISKFLKKHLPKTSKLLKKHLPKISKLLKKLPPKISKLPNQSLLRKEAYLSFRFSILNEQPIMLPLPPVKLQMEIKLQLKPLFKKKYLHWIKRSICLN